MNNKINIIKNISLAILIIAVITMISFFYAIRWHNEQLLQATNFAYAQGQQSIISTINTVGNVPVVVKSNITDANNITTTQESIEWRHINAICNQILTQAMSQQQR